MHFTVLTLVCCCHVVAAISDGFFWHITDFHYDFSYYDYPDGQYSCNTKVPADRLGKYGDYLCDPPWTLVNSSIYAMSSIKPDPDFIIWTGDNILHTLQVEEADVLSEDINIGIIVNMTNLLHELFPGVPIYPSVGNHDNFPDAQFPPHNDSIYNKLADAWGQGINDVQALEDFKKGGYYSVLLETGLRLVSLNTVFYYTRDLLTKDMEDPGSQYTWLENVLKSARTIHEKVFIIAHVPPGIKLPDGFTWFTKYHNERFSGIVVDYKDIIVATFYGHDHEDSFKIFYDAQDTPVVPMLIAPALTPWRFISDTYQGPARNPGVRLVQFSHSSGTVQDVMQYYLPLVDANRGASGWMLAYSARNDYNVSDVTAASLHTILERFSVSGDNAFANFYSNFFVKAKDETYHECTSNECISNYICGTRYLDMDNYKSCLNTKTTSRSHRIEVASNFLIALSYLIINYLK